jgi:hypothetical protein
MIAILLFYDLLIILKIPILWWGYWETSPYQKYIKKAPF